MPTPKVEIHTDNGDSEITEEIQGDTFKYSSEELTSPNPLRRDPVAVVTGANRGIGYGIVQTLCRRMDGFIYLTSRNKTNGLEALAKLKNETKCYRPEKVRYHQLDITSRESAIRLRDDIAREHGGLSILINNAAIALPLNSTNLFSEDANTTLQTNFFGTLMVCQVLFPLLRPYARVVNVGSSAGLLDNLQRSSAGEALRKKLMNPNMTEQGLVDLMHDFLKSAARGEHVEDGWPDSAYSVSKIALTKLTFIHHEMLSKSPKHDIIINVVHPGPVKTGMNQRGQLTWEEGSRQVIYAAMLPHNATSPRGKLIWCDYFIIPWDSQNPPTNPSLSVDQQIYWNKPLLFTPNTTDDNIEFYTLSTIIPLHLFRQTRIWNPRNLTNPPPRPVTNRSITFPKHLYRKEPVYTKPNNSDELEFTYTFSTRIPLDVFRNFE